MGSTDSFAVSELSSQNDDEKTGVPASGQEGATKGLADRRVELLGRIERRGCNRSHIGNRNSRRGGM